MITPYTHSATSSSALERREFRLLLYRVQCYRGWNPTSHQNLLVQLVNASDGTKATRNERFVQVKQHTPDRVFGSEVVSRCTHTHARMSIEGCRQMFADPTVSLNEQTQKP